MIRMVTVAVRTRPIHPALVSVSYNHRSFSVTYDDAQGVVLALGQISFVGTLNISFHCKKLIYVHHVYV